MCCEETAYKHMGHSLFEGIHQENPKLMDREHISWGNEWCFLTLTLQCFYSMEGCNSGVHRRGIFSYRIAICDSKSSSLGFILKIWCNTAIEIFVPKIQLLCRIIDSPENCITTWRSGTSTSKVRGSFAPLYKFENSRTGCAPWTPM